MISYKDPAIYLVVVSFIPAKYKVKALYSYSNQTKSAEELKLISRDRTLPCGAPGYWAMLLCVADVSKKKLPQDSEQGDCRVGWWEKTWDVLGNMTEVRPETQGDNRCSTNACSWGIPISVGPNSSSTSRRHVPLLSNDTHNI